MNFQPENDKENALQRREQELQERERIVRLRELEAEIHSKSRDKEIPIHQTERLNSKENSLKRSWRKLITWAKFIGFVIVGIGVVWVGVQVGIFLTYALIASLVGFVGYKLFLEKDRSNKS
jgi:Flp pilus assembly protein TadB